jgi:hypothetical protein
MADIADYYLANDRLRLCSLGARGLWLEILFFMQKCDPRGYLQQESGKLLTLEQIARFAGCSNGEVTLLLQELIDSGSAGVSEQGVIFCGHMVQNEALRKVRSAAGSKGGRVTAALLKQNGKQPSSKEKGRKGKVPQDPKGAPLSLFEEGSGRGASSILEGFDDFWAAFPRKTAKSAAEKAWKKLAPSTELRAEILAALENQKQWRQWNREDGQFIPHPATWLNGRRWEDQEEKRTHTYVGAGVRAWAQRAADDGTLFQENHQ